MSALRKVYRFVSAMQTGLVLLALIGTVSALGSAFWPDAFFNTRLFKLLFFLLFLNITSCTANRLSRFKRRFWKGFQDRRGWLRQFGMLLLHAGTVLVIAGGAVYAFYGQQAVINLAEGETVDVSGFVKGQRPFALHLNEFEIEFNQDGSPSQYYSQVAVLDDGAGVKKYSLSVNHPLCYGGVKAYQESFGYLVKARSMTGAGGEKEDLLTEGEILPLPGTERVVKVFRYVPNFDPSCGMNSKTLRPDNPRVIFSVYEGNKLLGVGAAKFGERLEIDDASSVVFTGVEPYTVLKLKSDPGLPSAMAGGVMLAAGVLLAVFSRPSRLESGPGGEKDEMENLNRRE